MALTKTLVDIRKEPKLVQYKHTKEPVFVFETAHREMEVWYYSCFWRDPSRILSALSEIKQSVLTI